MPDERGPIDWEALRETEGVFRSRLGDLVIDVSYVPNAIDPIELRLTVGTGFEADSARFDVQWWEYHGYKYHYREECFDRTANENEDVGADRGDPVEPPRSIEFRFGWERRPESTYSAKHFHPPDDLESHHESCISHEEPTLVTLAVLACWWRALEADDPEILNSQFDPP
ncbi:hypothetical protein [Halovivax cerinus]|uniref:Uncharacterized protein n=1 Tax=Halovivax cerinus TaxID=1487865 RepID=A0ABD5NQJ2_9EURY|nr:hypothetical protein [Halovivax cerinus]